MRKLGLCIIVFIISIMHIKVDARGNAFVEESKVVYEEDTIHTYRHEATGLKVIWIENDDTKKSFNLGVKTPTVDNSGVNHIIEHSIFTGSEKYPSSRLFFEASSAYPHIYMNASTSSDLTMYPFCTPYDVCFDALLDVYLDSIFNPSMLTNASSFYEEAFYYNPETKQCGGVVYNEMKGANDNEGRMIFRKIRESLYKGEHYANDSGGKPSDIPSLTYEQFVQTYKEYYNPNNMLIILYGKLPIKDTLKKIATYVEGRESGEDIEVNVDPINCGDFIITTQSQNDKNYFIKNFYLPIQLSVEEQINLDLWVETQMVGPKSPFRKTLHKKGINFVEVIKDSELKHPTYSIIVSGIDQSNVARVNKALDESMQQLFEQEELEEYIIKDTIEKNKLMFYELDRSPTRGIAIADKMIREWAHDGELESYFIMRDELQKIEGISNDIKNILVEEAIKVDVWLQSDGADLKAEKTAIRTSIDEEEWYKICEDMKVWQNQNTNVVWDKINLKHLIIDEPLKYKEKENEGVKYLLFESDSKLLASELYLPTTHIAQEKLPYLFLYSYLLEEVAKEITPFEGVLDTKIIAVNQQGGYTPYIKIDLLTDGEKIKHEEILEIAREALREQDIKWYQVKINQYLARFSSGFQNDILATLTNLNLGSQSGYKRYMYESYYPLYEFCLELKKNNNNSFDGEIKTIDTLIYPTKESSIAIIGSKEAVNNQYTAWKTYCQENIKEQGEWQQYSFKELQDLNIYYKPTDVDYVVYSLDLKDRQVQAVDYLMCAYITSDYLQPNIRVKKGAYGSSMCVNFPNTLSIYTYRDPDYISSIDLIENMQENILENITKERVELAKSGAISYFQNQFALLSTDLKKASMLHLVRLMGVDDKYIKNTQQKIISSSTKDIKKRIESMNEEFQADSVGICTKKQGKQSEKGARIYKSS